ncbi:MAG: hypothetical protein IIA92_02395 [Chloroflexi bacterium]|nr:hypothetical protein [Chloroflexota bacterium]
MSLNAILVLCGLGFNLIGFLDLVREVLHSINNESIKLKVEELSQKAAEFNRNPQAYLREDLVRQGFKPDSADDMIRDDVGGWVERAIGNLRDGFQNAPTIAERWRIQVPLASLEIRFWYVIRGATLVCIGLALQAAGVLTLEYF